MEKEDKKTKTAASKSAKKPAASKTAKKPAAAPKKAASSKASTAATKTPKTSVKAAPKAAKKPATSKTAKAAATKSVASKSVKAESKKPAVAKEQKAPASKRPTTRSAKTAKPAAIKDEPSQASAAAPQVKEEKRRDDRRGERDGDFIPSSGVETVGGGEGGNGGKRRRNRNRNRNRRSEGAPQGPQSPVNIDPTELQEHAWKIFLGEVTEEGLALMDDRIAAEGARRAFLVAELFLTEAARRRNPRRDDGQALTNIESAADEAEDINGEEEQS